MVDVAQVLARAVACHQAGNLNDAERLYRDILRAQPDHPDATHLSGVAHFQRGDLAAAADQVTRAIGLDDDVAIYHANLGRIRTAQGRAADAADAYRRAIQLAPDDAAVHSDLAAALVQLGDFDAARTRARLALDLDPDLAQAHLNLGLALRGIGGTARRDAEACFQRAANLAPGLADAQQALGEALQARGAEDAAAECYRRAIRAQPGMVEAHCNLGNILRDRFDLDAALVQYEAALETNPEAAAVHANRGVALHEMGRLSEALDAYQRALAIAPDDAETRRNRAMTLLLAGRFEDAWPDYEQRWLTARFAPERRQWTAPRWTAEAVAGEGANTVLIHAEQGLGDTLQFVRYAGPLQDRGFHVTVECPGSLVRLVRAMPTVTQVIARGNDLPSHDYQIPMLSLPAAFRTTRRTIPADVPYLVPPEGAVAAWRDRLAFLPRPWIGLCWRGSPDHPRDRLRSPGLAALVPLLEATAATFVSLQKDGGAEEVSALGQQATIRDWCLDLTDFADSAALVANLDAVVTCDTAAGHLAGGLGRPVAMLLPKVAEWRWLIDGDDTPWYPDMRLFRQEQAGDWRDPVARIALWLDRLSN